VSEPESPIARALIDWHAREGRHHLPWQQERTPYRVWVSEIMLQQTQVATVIPYYERFMARFPDVRALADAPDDEVLHLWSGLGYYARARNLKRAAILIRDQFAGELPRDFASLAQLPGIGRSTAGAILALASDARYPILDGNVRRVLARYFAVAGNSAERAVAERLWALAERCTPHHEVAAYTQAIMDLGATLCVRRRPLCERCPLAARCQARRSGRQHELPTPRPARSRRRRRVFMVVALSEDGQVLLERRPASGVWGGLWCLPEFTTATAAAAFVRGALGNDALEPQPLSTVEHAFTHFDLSITPLLVRCRAGGGVMEGEAALWYNIHAPARVGLPAPIAALLAGLADESLFDGGAAQRDRRQAGRGTRGPHGAMCRSQARGRRPRACTVPGRARAAHLRQRLEGRLGAVAASSDHAHQRVPPDADRAQGAQVPRGGDGEILLRRGLQGARRLPAAQRRLGHADPRPVPLRQHRLYLQARA
jgi:A/G-specific adenine glycosylase